MSKNGKALTEPQKDLENQRVDAVVAEALGTAQPASADMSLTLGARILRNAKFVDEHRVIQDGRRFIVFAIQPRHRFRPETSMDALSANVTGELWIDEADRAVVRLIAITASVTEFYDSMIAPKAFTVSCYTARRLADGVYVPKHWCGSAITAQPLGARNSWNQWNLSVIQTEETLDGCRRYRATSRIEGLTEGDEQHKR